MSTRNYCSLVILGVVLAAATTSSAAGIWPFTRKPKSAPVSPATTATPPPTAAAPAPAAAPPTPPAPIVATFPLTVQNGTGSGTYPAGTLVPITADTPDQVPAVPTTGGPFHFSMWTAIPHPQPDVVFGDVQAATTTVVMPARPLTVNPTYASVP